MKKVLISLALLHCAWGETWKLNPGVSLGPIPLGQKYQVANKVLTPKDFLGTAQESLLRYKEGIYLEVIDKQITRIIINESSFEGKTGKVEIAAPGNLVIGSSQATMEQALGRNYLTKDIPVAKSEPKESYFIYQQMALGFRTKGGKIVEISTWTK